MFKALNVIHYVFMDICPFVDFACIKLIDFITHKMHAVNLFVDTRFRFGNNVFESQIRKVFEGPSRPCFISTIILITIEGL